MRLRLEAPWKLRHRRKTKRYDDNTKTSRKTHDPGPTGSPKHRGGKHTMAPRPAEKSHRPSDSVVSSAPVVNLPRIATATAVAVPAASAA